MSSEVSKITLRSMDQPCWIDIGPNQPPFECRLRQLSKSGGKLIYTAPDELPDEFNLYLTRDGKVGRKCLVVSREDVAIGFQFTGGKVQPPRWLPSIQLV